MSKRSRAIMSQEESSFNRQAEDAEADLVGAEQIDIGITDRNTNGVLTKASPAPINGFGAYRGTKHTLDKEVRALISRMCPTVKITAIHNDFNISSTIGGYQIVFDSAYYITRDANAADTLTSHTSQTLHGVTIAYLRHVYNKLINDASYNIAQVGGGTSVNTITYNSATESTLPSLVIKNFMTTKVFTNVGSNTIMIEVWDMLCEKNTDVSPLQAWFLDTDTDLGPYGMYKNSVQPTQQAAYRMCGDPGNRPNYNRDKLLKEHWSIIRKRRYLVRAGQSVTHIIKFPSTTLSHTQLYGLDDDGSGTTTENYLRNISVECLGFSMGEVCVDSTGESQKIAPSTAYLQGRSNWEISATVSFKGRKNFDIVALWPLSGSFATRGDLYPTIASANQRIISQSAKPELVSVTNLDI